MVRTVKLEKEGEYEIELMPTVEAIDKALQHLEKLRQWICATDNMIEGKESKFPKEFEGRVVVAGSETATRTDTQSGYFRFRCETMRLKQSIEHTGQ